MDSGEMLSPYGAVRQGSIEAFVSSIARAEIVIKGNHLKDGQDQVMFTFRFLCNANCYNLANKEKEKKSFLW